MRTNSLFNLLAADAAALPAIGDGATIAGWTDRKACTVIYAEGDTIIVQRDNADRTDTNGMSDCQSYAYTADAAGARYTFTKRKDGKYYEKGQKAGTGPKLILGVRDEYYDFSF